MPLHPFSGLLEDLFTWGYSQSISSECMRRKHYTHANIQGHLIYVTTCLIHSGKFTVSPDLWANHTDMPSTLWTAYGSCHTGWHPNLHSLINEWNLMRHLQYCFLFNDILWVRTSMENKLRICTVMYRTNFLYTVSRLDLTKVDALVLPTWGNDRLLGMEHHFVDCALVTWQLVHNPSARCINNTTWA